MDFTRRDILKLSLLGTGALLLPTPARALIHPTTGRKEIAFHNLHTDERLRVTYWKKGRFDRSALRKINYHLRDFRSGDVYPISPNLIDLLHDVQTKLASDEAFEVISGYRSPKTNAMLAKASSGVAKRSLHMEGKAIDIRLPSTSLRKLQRTALNLRQGGVGFYEASDFVHLDVGRIRHWG